MDPRLPRLTGLQTPEHQLSPEPCWGAQPLPVQGRLSWEPHTQCNLQVVNITPTDRETKVER